APRRGARGADVAFLPAAGARPRVRNGLSRGGVGRNYLDCNRLQHTPRILLHAGLTLSPLTPAKAGVQGNNTPTQSFGPWIPAFAGMSGVCCARPTTLSVHGYARVMERLVAFSSRY